MKRLQPDANPNLVCSSVGCVGNGLSIRFTERDAKGVNVAQRELPLAAQR